MKHLILIGFMGTGKTSVGLETARRLQYSFLDLDDEITRRSGQTPGEWITSRGEEFFRDLESETLRRLNLRSPTVIACGGGAVLRASNRERLQELGFVIRLTARPEVLAERLAGDATRPLLPETSAREEQIRQLLARREAVYSLYPEEIDTSELTIPDVASRIITQFQPGNR